jgi:hypothetical protein
VVSAVMGVVVVVVVVGMVVVVSEMGGAAATDSAAAAAVAAAPHWHPAGHSQCSRCRTHKVSIQRLGRRRRNRRWMSKNHDTSLSTARCRSGLARQGA